MVNKTFWVFILGLLLSFCALGQESRDEKLFRHGFEKVIVEESEDTIKVFFEHRTFRNPYQSMGFARKILGELEDKTLVLIPLYHNRPIGKYTGEKVIFASLTEDERAVFKIKQDVVEGYRFHVRISPDIGARFGKFDDPFQHKSNLILDTRIYLFKGLSLHTGILLPLNNNLDAQEMNVRLAPSHFQLFQSVNSRHFYSLTAGLFFFDRYGIDFQYRFMPMDKYWSLGLETSFTGYYYLPNTGIYMNKLDELIFLVEAEYRLPFLPIVSIGVSAGQFLFQDKGMRLDFIRQYGNIDFGLFAALTQSGRNAGFQIAFPLFPGKILRNRNIEFRSTEEFRWEYGYNNEDIVARKFRLGTPRLRDVLRQYHPAFIKQQKTVF